MRKKISKLIVILLLLSIAAGYFSKIYWEPYYNYYFTKYDYSLPKPGEDFVVAIEPKSYNIPGFVKKIITHTFPEYNIVYNNNIKPNLIIRSEHIKTAQVLSKEYQTWNAPYITISSERWTIKRNRYRRNGPPIAELVSATPKKSRELYFPFVMWCGLKPEKIYTNHNREKFLAYIASNCVKARDQMFATIKSKNGNAEALGKCSNPEQQNIPGSWGNLTEIFAQYNFGLVMENHQIPGYITEKILNAFRGGAIPVYWGDSDTAARYFNQNAYVDIGKFATFQQAADYIIELNKDPARIASMQQEPIFINNKIPDFFNINETATKEIITAANFIRKEYFKFIGKINYLSQKE